MVSFPPPPERAPWEEVRELARRLDRLIDLFEAGIAIPIPGAPGLPGTPGVQPSLISLIKKTVPETIGASAVIPFKLTIAAATRDQQDRQVPFTGTVRDVIMAFPAGTQQLVDVRLMYFPSGGSRQLVVPSIDDSFIALDDVTVPFQPRMPVKAPGYLRVEWTNYDSLNSHTIPVIVTIFPTQKEK